MRSLSKPDTVLPNRNSELIIKKNISEQSRVKFAQQLQRLLKNVVPISASRLLAFSQDVEHWGHKRFLDLQHFIRRIKPEHSVFHFRTECVPWSKFSVVNGFSVAHNSIWIDFFEFDIVINPLFSEPISGSCSPEEFVGLYPQFLPALQPYIDSADRVQYYTISTEGLHDIYSLSSYLSVDVLKQETLLGHFLL